MFRPVLFVLMVLAGCSTLDGDLPPGTDPPPEPPGALRVVEAFPALSFQQPVDIQQPPAGTSRIFVVEKPGVIRIFENNETASTAEVFLDIRDRVNARGSEQGLLGLAFHPDYEQNGYFFVNYTADDPNRTVIARFERSHPLPDRADAGSELVILEVGQPRSNHNAGQLAFGPDGYLYVALGDGGGGGDPFDNGQDRTTLLGSLLRLDVDAAGAGKTYAIPSDNPFVGNTGGFREEIYAYGLRNPWRFSFDAATGDLWLADVGQGRIEEIDLVEAGGNYGWNVMEGSRCFAPSSGCQTAGLALPVAEYDHSQGISVTGGYVYRGTAAPALAGRYLYADFGSGRIWALDAATPATPNVEELFDTDQNISTFGIDRLGEVYFADFGGRIYKFVQ